ncbi:hypothetical protein [Virgibacillus sp. JSM 102003]
MKALKGKVAVVAGAKVFCTGRSTRGNSSDGQRTWVKKSRRYD